MILASYSHCPLDGTNHNLQIISHWKPGTKMLKEGTFPGHGKCPDINIKHYQKPWGLLITVTHELLTEEQLLKIESEIKSRLGIV